MGCCKYRTAVFWHHPGGSTSIFDRFFAVIQSLPFARVAPALDSRFVAAMCAAITGQTSVPSSVWVRGSVFSVGSSHRC